MIEKYENIIIQPDFFCVRTISVLICSGSFKQAEQQAEFKSNIGERTCESEKLLYGHGVLNKGFGYQSKHVTGYIHFRSIMIPLFYEILLFHSHLVSTYG